MIGILAAVTGAAPSHVCDGAEGMMMAGPLVLERILTGSALAVGIAAAAILLLGVVRGIVAFVAGELRSRSGRNAVLDDVRAVLGKYLLLGLELLVAADVLETILTPSLGHVAVLAGVVLIRTVIGFSLNWELERRHQSSSAPLTMSPIHHAPAVIGRSS